jgi:hypothetical protein
MPTKTSLKKARLTRILQHHLLTAVKSTGSYDPNKSLHYIEEGMTGSEYDAAHAFLAWVHANKLTFGHGTLAQRWAEWQATL